MGGTVYQVPVGHLIFMAKIGPCACLSEGSQNILITKIVFLCVSEFALCVKYRRQFLVYIFVMKIVHKVHSRIKSNSTYIIL